MKERILFCLTPLFLAPMFASGQLEKGNMLSTFSLYAGYAYHHYKESELKYNSYSVSLDDNVGVFIINQLAIGPGLYFNFGSSHGKLTQTPEDSNYIVKDDFTGFSVGLSPFLRYFLAYDHRLAWFTEISIQISYSNNRYKLLEFDGTEWSGKSNSMAYGASAALGLDYFITGNVGLETKVVYHCWQPLGWEHGTSYSQGVHTLLELSVGLNIFLHP